MSGPDVVSLSKQFEGDTPDEKLFVMLVAVATEYEKVIASVWSPGNVLGASTPRDIMLKGLRDNLELNEEDK